MTVNFNQSDSTATQSCYSWRGMVSQPTYRVIEYFTRYGNPADPKVFDNCSTKVREYAYRSFGPAALIGAAAFLARIAYGWSFFSCGGFSVANNGPTRPITITPIALALLAPLSKQDTLA